MGRSRRPARIFNQAETERGDGRVAEAFVSYLYPLLADNMTNEGEEQREAWLDPARLLVLYVKANPGSSYRAPPVRRSWTWSAWTELWWGLSLEGEELKGQTGLSHICIRIRPRRPLTSDL